jgi:hypothetical protein
MPHDITRYRRLRVFEPARPREHEGERASVLLGLTARSALARQVLAGALRPA